MAAQFQSGAMPLHRTFFDWEIGFTAAGGLIGDGDAPLRIGVFGLAESGRTTLIERLCGPISYRNRELRSSSCSVLRTRRCRAYPNLLWVVAACHSYLHPCKLQCSGGRVFRFDFIEFEANRHSERGVHSYDWVDDIRGLIWIVDSSNPDEFWGVPNEPYDARTPAVVTAFQRVLGLELRAKVRGLPLLVLCNKQDATTKTAEQILTPYTIGRGLQLPGFVSLHATKNACGWYDAAAAAPVAARIEHYRKSVAAVFDVNSPAGVYHLPPPLVDVVLSFCCYESEFVRVEGCSLWRELTHLPKELTPAARVPVRFNDAATAAWVEPDTVSTKVLVSEWLEWLIRAVHRRAGVPFDSSPSVVSGCVLM